MVGLGKEWIEEQGNEGRGRTEKTLILLFPKAYYSPQRMSEQEEDWGLFMREEMRKPMSPS